MTKNISGTKSLSIGQNVVIDNTSFIKGENVTIEDNVKIKKNVSIIAKNIFIGKNSIIGDDNEAEVSTLFSLGKNTILGKANHFHCRKFESGDFLYMGKNNEIGGGGSNSLNSEVTIGKYCMVVDRVILNTSDKIDIGDDVGIGGEVMIWTHGSYNSVLDGFPSNFAPVKIGSHVWIPARIVILPGVTIGDNIVIGINTLVNKNLPSGCMAAGMPVKVLRENFYPKVLSDEEKDNLINKLIEEYMLLLDDKGVQFNVSYEKGIINILSPEGETSFINIYEMTYGGIENIYFEDLRDFLRRKGIKIFTENLFRSITPIPFEYLTKL